MRDFSALYVRCGSAADIARHRANARFAPESGQRADISRCPLCAKSDLTHRSKQHCHSSTSRGPAIRRTGEMERLGLDHSGLMPADLITLAHFLVSSATSFPNSAGVIGMGSPASSARRARNFGSANTAFTA